MRHSLRYGLLGVMAVLLMGATPPAPEAVENAAVAEATSAVVTPHIMAHRAFYRMQLASAKNGSDVRGADGMMIFEWKDACDGWAIEQRLDVDFTHGESEGINLASTFIAWESKDGTRYRFNYRRLGNGQEVEAYRGTATLSAPGGEGKAAYTQPAPKDVVLPAGTYFPTSHTMAMLQAAVAGKPLFSAGVFDGTDAAGLSDISAVIGRRRPVQVALARTGSESEPDISWPVRMAFFPVTGDQAEPDYEMDTTLLPNGVSEFMLIDYGDFKLRGALEKIEVLPKPDC